MIYSRKRYWLAIAAAFAIEAVTVTLLIRLHPAHAGFWTMAMLAVCCALAFLAYFSQDEIQRQNGMRAWYYGGLLALLFGVVPFMLIAPDTTFEAMVGFFPHAANVPEAVLRHSHKVYFVLGFEVTFLAQLIGFFIARIMLRFRS